MPTLHLASLTSVNHCESILNMRRSLGDVGRDNPDSPGDEEANEPEAS